MHSMLVHMKNLPNQARSEDVRSFFREAGVQIPDGGLHITNSQDGSAFINLETNEDLLEAVKLDGHELLGEQVKLFLITMDEKEEILTELRKQDLMKSASGGGEGSKGSEKMKGGGFSQGNLSMDYTGRFKGYLFVDDLPHFFRKRSLMDFFGLQWSSIAVDGFVVRKKEESDLSVAFIKFVDERAYDKSFRKDGEMFMNRKVSIRAVDADEFEMERAKLKDRNQDTRKRESDLNEEGLPAEKRSRSDERDGDEDLCVVVLNLPEQIKPQTSGFKNVFGYLDYENLVIRQDKKKPDQAVAFIKFPDKESYEKALKKHRADIYDRQVVIKPYTLSSFTNELRQNGSYADKLAMADYCLFITNIDGSVSARELKLFFGRHVAQSIGNDGILMRPDLKFPEKQVAYIQFRTKEAYESVLNMDDKYLDGKRLYFKKSSEKQFLQQKRFIENDNRGHQNYHFGNDRSEWVGGGGSSSYGGQSSSMGNYGGNMMGGSRSGSFGGMGGDMGGGLNPMQNTKGCYILVNNLPKWADLKWVHQLFDDCPLNVSKTHFVSEGQLPLYAYVELQNEMDLQRAFMRDGRRFDDTVIAIKRVSGDVIERDLSTLPPRMRVTKMEMDKYFPSSQNQGMSGSQGYGQGRPSYGNDNYADEWSFQYDTPTDPSHTAGAITQAVRNLEQACGQNVDVVEIKAIPYKLKEDSIFSWLKQQPGNLEVVGKNSDIVTFGNWKVEVFLVALKTFSTALPKWAFVDNVVCEIRHKSQMRACPACRSLEHRNVGENCPAASENSDIYYFDAADHPFSPLHMSMMPFEYKTKRFVNVLHAYLWEECHFLGQSELRDSIFKIQDPRMANLKEIILQLPKLEALNWEMKSYNILKNLYKAKWEICPEFRDALSESGNKMLVFANSRCSLGVGLSPPYLVKKISPLYYQGENMIGKVVMSIRDDKGHLKST